jgi:hypothetical protein
VPISKTKTGTGISTNANLTRNPRRKNSVSNFQDADNYDRLVTFRVTEPLAVALKQASKRQRAAASVIIRQSVAASLCAAGLLDET